jgi:hypothetical protein
MNKNKLKDLSNDELLGRFVELGVRRHDAALELDTETCNKLVDKTGEIFSVLKSRGEETHRLLLPLMHHENAGVRLAAASYCFSIEPIAARAALQSFNGEDERHESAMGMTLLFLHDKGQWTPP